MTLFKPTLVITTACSIFLSASVVAQTPNGTVFSVYFNSPIQYLNKYSIGSTISTYEGGSDANGWNGRGNILKSNDWATALSELGPLAWRIPLACNLKPDLTCDPGSAAGGARDQVGRGDDYINTIRAMGGYPVIVVGTGFSRKDSNDNDFTPQEAASLVKFFNSPNSGFAPIQQWIIGNEYSNNNDTNQNPGEGSYQSMLPKWAKAMKDADYRIKLSAPAAPDMQWSDTVMSDTVNSFEKTKYIDFLSYHAYQGQSRGLGATSDYRTVSDRIKRTYITADKFGPRYTSVKTSLEEFNWRPYYAGDAEFYNWKNTVFVASVIGHSLSSGARAYHYSDSNGPLGLMNDGSGKDNQPGQFLTRFPAYWGIGMWTGMNGKFRRFGSVMVDTSFNRLPAQEMAAQTIEIFATSNGKIIVINKGDEPFQGTLNLGARTTKRYRLTVTNPDAPFSSPVSRYVTLPTTTTTIPLTLHPRSVASYDLF